MKVFLISIFLLVAFTQNGFSVTYGISEEDFNLIIDDIVGLYRDDLGFKNDEFILHKDWQSSQLRAQAIRLYSRTKGTQWGFRFHGGIARHPQMSRATFSFIVCHEIGHFLGGYPHKRGRRGAESWSSTEGQADFFAASKCLKRYYRYHPQARQPAHFSRFNADIIHACLHKRPSQQQECIDIIKVGLSAASFFRHRRIEEGQPVDDELNFDFSNLNQVRSTINSHPTPKCRLATIVAGAQCDLDDQSQDYCNTRPSCWYNSTN